MEDDIDLDQFDILKFIGSEEIDGHSGFDICFDSLNIAQDLMVICSLERFLDLTEVDVTISDVGPTVGECDVRTELSVSCDVRNSVNH